jgi:phospholipase C
MANIKYLVVVMMENRSFDEYFGTFPGVSGFSDESPAFAQPWESGQPFPPNPLYPWRMSTFTTSAADTPGGAHQWNSMHQSVNPEPVISGLNYPQGANNLGFYFSQGWAQPWSQSGALMGYYVADDIPYHWALASNFALCDQYFCSVLSGTGPNRMYAVGGTILPSDSINPSIVESPPAGNIYSVNNYPPVLNNVSAASLGVVGSADPDGRQPSIYPPFNCPNYLTALYKQALQNPMENEFPTYRVYDDWNWAWGGAEATGTDGVYTDLNVFYYYEPVNGVQLGAGAVAGSATADPHYFAANDTAQGAPGDTRPLFAQHINPDPQYATEGDTPILAKVTWIFPPWNYCEHPSNSSSWKSADGARYLSQIVDALIASDFWEETVLVVTYDETNNNFDHVIPPFPTPEQEPWVNALGEYPLGYAAPIGAGMRVPAIIVSPWTYGAGVIHTPMDHTSMVQLVEALFDPPIPCTALPQPGWRRSTFANLGDVITNLGTLPVQAATIQQERSSPTGLPTSETAQQWQTNAEARYTREMNDAPKAPLTKGWPAVPQACVFTEVQSYNRAQIGTSTSPVTLANAVSIQVNGFEPQEFIEEYAGVPGPVPYPGMLQENVPVLTGGRCTTRIPSVIAVGRNDITFTCTGVSSDPNAAAPSAQQGIPQPFTFTFSIRFQNPADTFANVGPAIFMIWLDLQAWFTVDTTVTAQSQLYLTLRSLPPWGFTKITEFGNILGSGGGVVIDVQPGDPGSVLRAFSAPLRRELIHIINQIDVDASNAIDQFSALLRDAFGRHGARKTEG